MLTSTTNVTVNWTAVLSIGNVLLSKAYEPGDWLF
jgi:hypothetical protein